MLLNVHALGVTHLLERMCLNRPNAPSGLQEEDYVDKCRSKMVQYGKSESDAKQVRFPSSLGRFVPMYDARTRCGQPQTSNA